METEFAALLNFPTRWNPPVAFDKKELIPLEDFSPGISVSRSKNSIEEDMREGLSSNLSQSMEEHWPFQIQKRERIWTRLASSGAKEKN